MGSEMCIRDRSNGGTQEAKLSVRMEMYVQAASPLMSEMLVTNGVSCDGERNQVAKQLTSHCREKLLVR